MDKHYIDNAFIIIKLFRYQHNFLKQIVFNYILKDLCASLSDSTLRRKNRKL